MSIISQVYLLVDKVYPTSNEIAYLISLIFWPARPIIHPIKSFGIDISLVCWLLGTAAAALFGRENETDETPGIEIGPV